MEGKLEKVGSARQRSQAETKNRLLASAVKLFGEKGSSKTTTKEIATEAEVAVGTVYLHFSDKDALLKEVLKLALVRLKQELAKQPAAPGEGYALVRNKMTSLADFTLHFPDLARVLFDSGNLASKAGREALDFLTKSQENGLLAGISAGYYRGDLHSGLTAMAMVGILSNILGYWAQNPEAVSKTEVVEVLTELRMNGLKPLT